MTRALDLASRGVGSVEPNPAVGCVIARGEREIGCGWHPRYGGPHAEIVALDQTPGDLSGATMYVTLEPCCHHGKTPPCTRAILAAGVTRVVVAMVDPYPRVSGRGIGQLRAAGLQVDVGLLRNAAQELTAPYRKLIASRRPFVIAKWAMTLDGKLATAIGDSQWISGPQSRRRVHQLRGRVDAIMVGGRTAVHDNPHLTARPAGPRRALRVVCDPACTLSPESNLAQTAREMPVLVAVGPGADTQRQQALRDAGCEVLSLGAATHADQLRRLLDELGRRRVTNLLVEGGGRLLGGLLEIGELDEVHVFVAPKLIGGRDAVTPIAGSGIATIRDALQVDRPHVEQIEGDVYIWGRLAR
jgi:diaminohydroxyphosphoribosylaminopyrimidine deaminase/5-amino-6-(5-phosphoribosylamino)uracil reductase